MAVYKGGRPRRNTPEDVSKAVDTLIAEYNDKGTLPTDYRLMQALNISSRTLDKYYEGTYDRDIDNSNDNDGNKDGTGSRDGYCDVLKRLIQFRAQICTDGLATTKTPTGLIFLSKQPRWGGYQDRLPVDTSSGLEVNIRLVGEDGKPIGKVGGA